MQSFDKVKEMIICKLKTYGKKGIYSVEMDADGSLHIYDYFTGEYDSCINLD